MTPSSCLLHDLGWDRLEERRTKQLVIAMYKGSIITFHFAFIIFFKQCRESLAIICGTRLIISLLPDYSLKSENVACTIEMLHYGTASQLLAKPRPLLLLSKNPR